ncbi:MAG: hypothetical protein U5K69_28285 [Balneolaceae bacterium]|nr:hypothetical protein [Balneolaceae bacterium]
MTSCRAPVIPTVYAAGDTADTNGLPLTPVAGFESHIVASNLLEGNHKQTKYPAQPTVGITIPPLAMVAITEQQAKDQGYEVKVKFDKIDDWYSYKRTNESHTAYKTIINKENGQLLGAHVLGSKSEELINLFAMAMNQKHESRGIKENDLTRIRHTHQISRIWFSFYCRAAKCYMNPFPSFHNLLVTNK